MLFTQPIFFVFVLCFFVGWRLLGSHSSFRLTFLVAASFVFYSFADWHHLLILLAAGGISYLGGLGIEKQPRFRLPILLGTLAASLCLLFIFKYRDFFAENLHSFFGLVGLKVAIKPVVSGKVQIPPLGIGFYILQSVGYLLDVYHGRLKPTQNVIHFLAYLALFPKLLAGPIERGKDLLPQLVADPILPTEKQRWEGTKFIVFGYFLKVVIADNLTPFVDTAFNAPVVRGGSLYWWVVVTAFAVQLYSDFSGYSSIAIGLGKWMGYDLSINFKNPYTATSLAEFWNRWHITLSNWLRDYIFFPLNRSRLGKGRPHLSMWITMLVSGLWHGAAWHFIFWGALHGLYISIERVTQWSTRLKRCRGGNWAALFLVLLQVWIGWVFFRAATLKQGFQIIHTMFSFTGGLGLKMEPIYTVCLALGVMREVYSLFHFKQNLALPAFLKGTLEVVFISLLVVISVFFRGPGSQFIYFQF